MGTILDMTKVFLFSVCLSLLTTDVAWDSIFSFVHVWKFHYPIFSKNGAGHRHNGCNLFMIK